MIPQIHGGCRQPVCPSCPDRVYALTTWHLFLVGLLCSVLVTGWLPWLGRAEGIGRIRGVIQREGQGFAEQRIMLIRFGPNQEVQRFPGQTDAEGRFLFENLETGGAFTYFVGIRYKEQLYRSEPVVLQGEDPVEVILAVGEPSTQEAKGGDEQSKLRIMNHLMVIVGRDRHLEVREVVRVVNAGTTPYTAEPSHSGVPGMSLHLPLPQGHYNMGQVQGLAAESIRVDASGLSYVAPLTQGEHQVVYTYNLPWHDELATILIERTLSTSTLDVLVEDAHLHTTSDLQFRERVSIDPHVFAHFRGMNLVAHSRSWLQLMPRQTSVSVLLGAYGLIIGITLLGVVLPLRNVWHERVQQGQRDTGAMKPKQIQDVKGAGRDLLWGMARLDDAHNDGMIDEATYQQRRQVYKDQLVELVELVEQLQRSQAGQEARDERRGEM
jgi:hypothetical protein